MSKKIKHRKSFFKVTPKTPVISIFLQLTNIVGGATYVKNTPSRTWLMEAWKTLKYLTSIFVPDDGRNLFLDTKFMKFHMKVF